MRLIRYIISPIAGLTLALLTFYLLVVTVPGAPRISFFGLTPMIISGAMGGALTAVVAPKYKIAIASMLGLSLGGCLLAIMAFSEQFPLLGRNPLLWYWPAWLIPAFFLGGVLGKRLRNDV